jgi:hydrogenase small subunit
VSTRAVKAYGGMIRRLRTITAKTVDKEPSWRHRGSKLTTGYTPRWR